MEPIHIPENASELMTMLWDNQIDIFDALEYAPRLATDKRGMSRLKNRMKERERARNKKEQATIEEKGESDVEQGEE